MDVNNTPSFYIPCFKSGIRTLNTHETEGDVIYLMIIQVIYFQCNYYSLVCRNWKYFCTVKMSSDMWCLWAPRFHYMTLHETGISAYLVEACLLLQACSLHHIRHPCINCFMQMLHKINTKLRDLATCLISLSGFLWSRNDVQPSFRNLSNAHKQTREGEIICM
jgi:hypothetical protein